MEKPFLILSLLMLSRSTSFVSSQGAPVVNIACGADASFTDTYGNQWVGDYQLIGSGYTALVQFFSPDAPFLSTVRYFPYGSRNCYTIPGVTQGAAIRVDAIFQYGNYDNRGLPPSFELQIDGSNWADVQTSPDLVWYRRNYLAVASSVSVCLAPNSLGFVPFISAIRIFQVQTGSSTPDINPDKSGSSTLPSPERINFSSSSIKVRAKGIARGMIYLATLFPGGTIVVVAIIIAVVCKKNKKKKAEADMQLGAVAGSVAGA